MNPTELLCDGCGQPASPEHIARRLQRLEWTTRFRPVHIGALLLGAVAPKKDSEFLYSPGGDWGGEAKLVLAAAGVSQDGKSAEAALAEFQRGGFLLTHVLECPLEGDPGRLPALMASRLPGVLTRIRRSLSGYIQQASASWENHGKAPSVALSAPPAPPSQRVTPSSSQSARPANQSSSTQVVNDQGVKKIIVDDTVPEKKAAPAPKKKPETFSNL